MKSETDLHLDIEDDNDDDEDDEKMPGCIQVFSRKIEYINKISPLNPTQRDCSQIKQAHPSFFVLAKPGSRSRSRELCPTDEEEYYSEVFIMTITTTIKFQVIPRAMIPGP